MGVAALEIFVPVPLCIAGALDLCSLCDANGDDLCTVSDIVAINIEIFSPHESSRCARAPFPGPP